MKSFRFTGASGPRHTPSLGASLVSDPTRQAVKKMLARAKELGYVPYDEINTALPQDKISSEQIEDTMAMLWEMGV